MNDSLKEGVNRVKDKSKKSQGFARREYQSVQPEIMPLLEKGGLRFAYKKLLTAGRLSMAYATFCEYVRGDAALAAYRKKKQLSRPNPPDLPDEFLDFDELAFDDLEPDFRYDLKSVHQDLTELGVVGFGYSDFRDYFSDFEV